ncbi:Mov34/MPN/PAD-1 family protein [Paenibacillus sp. sgz500958]|uniref:Mov34/MPN/PAD-1 family protein n=1 Tax=Paenibacillus sp. sgz500958 TaxID=3242475 RepID=UPI0036D2AFDE
MTAFQGQFPPIGLKNSAQQLLGEHLLSSYPREACGILLGAAAAGGMRIDTYVPIRNVAPDPLHAFIPHPEDWVKTVYLEPAPIGFFHSHPHSSPEPSFSDLAGLTALGPEFLVYLIGSPGQDSQHPSLNGYYIDRFRNVHGKLECRLVQAAVYALLK